MFRRVGGSLGESPWDGFEGQGVRGQGARGQEAEGKAQRPKSLSPLRGNNQDRRPFTGEKIQRGSVFKEANRPKTRQSEAMQREWSRWSHLRPQDPNPRSGPPNRSTSPLGRAPRLQKETSAPSSFARRSSSTHSDNSNPEHSKSTRKFLADPKGEDLAGAVGLAGVKRLSRRNPRPESSLDTKESGFIQVLRVHTPEGFSREGYVNDSFYRTASGGLELQGGQELGSQPHNRLGRKMSMVPLGGYICTHGQARVPGVPAPSGGAGGLGVPGVPAAQGVPGGQGAEGSGALRSEGSEDKSIHLAVRSLMISMADPHGDFSWGVPEPKTFTLLPDKLAVAKDWDSFKLVMCDLRFLWRKLQVHGAVEVVRAYQVSQLGLQATGFVSERLLHYEEFVMKHFRLLQKNPNNIFSLAVVAKQEYVRSNALEIVQHYEQLISHWHNKLKSSHRDHGSRPLSPFHHGPRHTLSETPSASSGAAANTSNSQQRAASTMQIMQLVNLKGKLSSLHECGLSACLAEAAQTELKRMLETLVQRIQSLRSNLVEKGLKNFEDETRTVLDIDGCDDGPNIILWQPRRFLDLVRVWDHSDIQEFANLSIYIPPRVWNDSSKKINFEQQLVDHVAEAARIPHEQVEIVEISCNEEEAKKGMPGKALIKLMDHVKGLEVMVIQGENWAPESEKLALKSDPRVTIKLRDRQTAHRRKSSGAGRPSNQREHEQVFHTKSRPQELHAQHPEFHERFEILLYDMTQELVVTAVDKGTKNAVGELCLRVDELIKECHRYEDESFERSYLLGKNRGPTSTTGGHGSMLDAESMLLSSPTLTLEFRSFTKQAQNGLLPQQMAENVMLLAQDDISPLRLHCICTGPAFPEADGSWETVRIYISSNYAEMHAERNFLKRYVLPALYVKCLGLRVKFKWADLSSYGSPGLRDDLVKRLDTLSNCRIRTYDKTGQNRNAVFFLGIVGEKQGRHFLPAELKKLEMHNQLHGGKYNAAVKLVKEGASGLEVELQHGCLIDPKNSLAVICLRDPTFTGEKRFAEEVPASVRACYSEKNIKRRTAFAVFRKRITTQWPDHVFHYSPHFLTYAGGETEEVWGKSAQDAARHVKLGGLEEFGLQVFEQLWRQIRQRFSFSRAKSIIRSQKVAHDKQIAAVRSLTRQLVITHGGSQEKLLIKLTRVANFLEPCNSVTLLVGPHGSGKSSLLSWLVLSLGLIPKIPGEKVKIPGIGEDTRLLMRDPALFRSLALLLIYDKNVLSILTNVAPSEASHFDTQRRTSVSEEGEQNGDPSGGKKQLNKAQRSSTDLDENVLEDEESPEAVAMRQIKDLLRNDGERQSILPEDLMHCLDCVQNLMHSGLNTQEMAFRAQDPIVIFFIKRPHHTTSDLQAYLCSYLQNFQDESMRSWRRFEELLRQRVNERELNPAFVPQPVLLILDGLEPEERDHIRRITLCFGGKVRAVLGVNSTSPHPSDGHVESEADMNWRESCDIIIINPLLPEERQGILEAMFQHVGVRKWPSNLLFLISRPAAQNPMYLVIIVAYVRCCIALKHPAPRLSQLKHDVVELVAQDILPMLEKGCGARHLQKYFEILLNEPAGLGASEIGAIMCKCNVPVTESKIGLLSNCIRTMSDPVHTSSGGLLSINRPSIVKGYEMWKSAKETTLVCQDDALEEIRRIADEQDSRLDALQSRLLEEGRTTFGSRGLDSGDVDDDDELWLSDDEDEMHKANESRRAAVVIQKYARRMRAKAFVRKLIKDGSHWSTSDHHIGSWKGYIRSNSRLEGFQTFISRVRSKS